MPSELRSACSCSFFSNVSNMSDKSRSDISSWITGRRFFRSWSEKKDSSCRVNNLIYALVRALLLGLVEDVHVVGALDGRLGAVLDERDGVVELERRARLRCGEPVSVSPPRRRRRPCDFFQAAGPGAVLSAARASCLSSRGERWGAPPRGAGSRWARR